jgi:hypothetical protein
MGFSILPSITSDGFLWFDSFNLHIGNKLVLEFFEHSFAEGDWIVIDVFVGYELANVSELLSWFEMLSQLRVVIQRFHVGEVFVADSDDNDAQRHRKAIYDDRDYVVPEHIERD